MCAVWESSDGSVLFPFILRDIPPIGSPTADAALKDIVSPYGYGGAFVWGTMDVEAAAELFSDAFDKWASQNRVVSEFVRLSLFPNSILPFDGDTSVNQMNVVCDLSLDEEALWMGFEHKVRKNVNRARKSGVTVVVDEVGERVDDFVRIYEGTLDRRSARANYYFDIEFFKRVHEQLGGQYAYFHALHAGAVVSTELVLLSAQTAYSFLGGTESTAFDLRPNDFLKYEIIRWVKNSGRQWFVLGGGYEPDDGIFRYKKAFAPNGIRPFTVGRRVFDTRTYERLVAARDADATRQKSSGFFPEYRS